MNVLDPFEVYKVRVWPLPQLQNAGTSDVAAAAMLNSLEYSVFVDALKASHFGAVLNEKIPSFVGVIDLPQHYEGVLVAEKVYEIRSHPDVRIARRAATLARLAQVISERKVNSGLRRTLLVQAKRLQWLSERRENEFKGQPDDEAEDQDQD
jgi:hypothetical protein